MHAEREDTAGHQGGSSCEPDDERSQAESCAGDQSADGVLREAQEHVLRAFVDHRRCDRRVPAKPRGAAAHGEPESQHEGSRGDVSAELQRRAGDHCVLHVRLRGARSGRTEAVDRAEAGQPEPTLPPGAVDGALLPFRVGVRLQGREEHRQRDGGAAREALRRFRFPLGS